MSSVQGLHVRAKRNLMHDTYETVRRIRFLTCPYRSSLMLLQVRNDIVFVFLKLENLFLPHINPYPFQQHRGVKGFTLAMLDLIIE